MAKMKVSYTNLVYMCAYLFVDFSDIFAWVGGMVAEGVKLVPCCSYIGPVFVLHWSHIVPTTKIDDVGLF